MIIAMTRVMTVVALYSQVMRLLLLSLIDSHKLCDIIIQISMPIIAIIEIPNKRHIEKLFAICHIVVNTKPNAPVVKAIATILLKLAIMFNGLFAKVIPLTSLNIPLERESDKYLKW